MPDQIEEIGPAQIEELGPSEILSPAEELGPIPNSLKKADPFERAIVAGSMSRFQATAAERLEKIKAEQAKAAEVPSYFSRVGEEFGEIPGMAEKSFSAPDHLEFGEIPKSPFVEGEPDPLMKGMSGLATILKPVGAIFGPMVEPAARSVLASRGSGITQLMTGGKSIPRSAADYQPEAEGIGDTVGMLAEAMVPLPGVAKKAAETRRTRVVDPKTGTIVDKNPPADVPLQDDLIKKFEEKGVDTSDVQAMGDHVAEREGVPPPKVEVDPAATISKTEADGSKVTVEPGTPGEVATRIEHEVGQHVPEKMGLKEPPIENNNAIVIEGLIKESPDGFTIDPNGKPVTTGYSYSPYKKLEWVMDQPPSAKTIAAFMKQNAEKLAEPGNNLGGWYNKENGKWYLDVSKNTPDYALAKSEAEAAGQIAIFDHYNLQDIKLGIQVPPEIADSLLREGISKNVVQAAGKLFVDGTITRDTSRLISDQVMEAVVEGRVDIGALQKILDTNNVSLEQFGREMLRVKASDAGRTLQRYSTLQRLLNSAVKSNLPILSRMIDRAAGPTGRLYWRYGAVRDIWRGLLTSQFSTAIRNAQSQGVRFGIDAADKTISAGIQRLMGKDARANFDPTLELSPLDGMGEFFNLIHGGKNKRLADELQKQVPDLTDRLFTSYNSDISTRIGLSPHKADKALAKAQQAVGILNWANQAQEFMWRRTNLVASLETKLSKVGRSLETLVDKGGAAKFFEDGVGKQILDDVIKETLDKTFASSPKYGTFMYHTIAAINRLPGASIVIPFPRFIYNSSKFFFEHSPFGLIKLLSPAERAAIAKGDVATYSKAITGMMMFGTAYAARKSEFAGEKFYEFKGPSGTTIDMRPFAPYLGYLFLADAIKRVNEGTANDDFLVNLAETALSANVRAGTGLFILDQVGRLFSSRSNPDRLSEVLLRATGEFAAGFLTPMQQLRDVTSEYDEYLKVQRDVMEEPFLGPIKQKLPMESGLPEKESPFQADAPREVSPGLKQASGYRLIEPKNEVQSELDRLGLSEFEMVPKSGERSYDRLVAQKMGPMVEEELGYFVRTTEYQILDNSQKIVAMKEQFKKIHRRAIKEAKSEAPEAYEKAKAARKPWYEKAEEDMHPSDVDLDAIEDTETP